MTNYNVKIFVPAKMQITVSSYNSNNMEDEVNGQNLVREIIITQNMKQ